MATHINQNSIWDDPATIERTLIVRKSAFLTTLTHLKSLDNIKNVREGLVKLIQSFRLEQSELLLPTNNDDSVEFNQNYLLDELDQILATQTLERTRYYIERLRKAITEVKTTQLNDINLNRWKEYEDIYTDSLWIVDKRDGSGVHRANYWGNFIPQIPNQMIRRYTKAGEWVLDTFAGSGTTLIEGQRLGRNTVGLELQAEVARRTDEVVATEPNQHAVVSQVIVGDSTTLDYKEVLAKFGQSAVQLVIMHPPYFDIIKFSDDQNDLSNTPTIEVFLAKMGQIVDNASTVLEKNRYMVLVIGDKFAKGECIPLGFMTMTEVLKRGYSLKSIIVKNFEDTSGKRKQKELWKYRALAGGFYVFKHEYIFLFKRDAK